MEEGLEEESWIVMLFYKMLIDVKNVFIICFDWVNFLEKLVGWGCWIFSKGKPQSA